MTNIYQLINVNIHSYKEYKGNKTHITGKENVHNHILTTISHFLLSDLLKQVNPFTTI